MRLCSIASGSSGNCVYVGHASTHLLIDAGISGKKIEQGLLEVGVEPETLGGILVTHEHSDHIQGIGVLAKKYGIPIYGTVETFCAMRKGKTSIGKVEDALFQQIHPETEFRIGEIRVTPFSVSHDAANPVAYIFEAEGHKIGMATDLGVYTDKTVGYLQGAELLYLESNHDENMLMVGKYPYYLKQRILGNHGHLSNDTAAELLCRLYHAGLQHVLLAHLSKENNYPELAYETVKAELLLKVGAEAMPNLMVAPRDTPSEMFTIQ